MKKIKLTKIRELDNAETHNNIKEKEYRIVRMVELPKVGECFMLRFVSNVNGTPICGHWFRTSTVMEIISKSTFMTRNSIYKIRVLKDPEVEIGDKQ